jgi:hypothetical protein
VLASVGPANFRMLTLPALDAPPVRSAKRRAAPKPSNPLEALMSAFTAGRPATRTVKAVADPSTEWITAAVELRVRRPTARRGPS